MTTQRIDDRPYFVATCCPPSPTLRCRGSDVVPWPILEEVRGSDLASTTYREKRFYIAWMKFGRWIWGHGLTRDRAITHMTERYEEAKES